jgi:arylsulfatase A
MRKGSWKLIETFDPGGLQLYNLADDLGETRNLAPSQTKLVEELRRELDAWRREVGADMMKPNPDYDSDAQLSARKKKARKANQQ